METKEVKLCKHCQTEIPKKAKVCPNCRKKQGRGIGKWIGIAIVFLMVIGIATSGSDDGDKPNKVGEVSTQSTPQNQEKSNVFGVGDIVETKNLRITYINASVYVSDNQFLRPKDGYEYWKFEFKFENISDSDQTVSSMIDWECYADNSKVDQSWIGDGNGLDATLSPGRTAQGSVYFEVPVDVENIELEYKMDFWKSDKIIFIGK